MGVGTILDSRELLLLASGASKARIVSRAVEGPLTSRISASAIQLHPCCKVILDAAAASELDDLDYYRLVVRHENKWDSYKDLLSEADG
jgi:glucosamine-6-phosphate deaminase